MEDFPPMNYEQMRADSDADRADQWAKMRAVRISMASDDAGELLRNAIASVAETLDVAIVGDPPKGVATLIAAVVTASATLMLRNAIDEIPWDSIGSVDSVGLCNSIEHAGNRIASAILEGGG